MRLVIAQFFNEAYLLPWWLSHHREIFDHGILIDDHSTDGSVDICRELVPHWEVVKAEYTPFEAITRDFEVMKHELRFPDAWKMVLNITEFLVSRSLSDIEGKATRLQNNAVRLQGAIMVDIAPDDLPNPDRPLVEQKAYGIWENDPDLKRADISFLDKSSRSRVYHCDTIGAYAPGRHTSHLPGQFTATAEEGAIFWYGFSPWSSEFKARKLQVGGSMGAHDFRYGFSSQHQADLEQMELWWKSLRPLSRSLYPRTPTPLDLATAANEKLHQEIERLHQDVDRLCAELADAKKLNAETARHAKKESEHLHGQLEKARAQLIELRASTSWKMTRPLRSLASTFARARNGRS